LELPDEYNFKLLILRGEVLPQTIKSEATCDTLLVVTGGEKEFIRPQTEKGKLMEGETRGFRGPRLKRGGAAGWIAKRTQGRRAIHWRPSKNHWGAGLKGLEIYRGEKKKRK